MSLASERVASPPSKMSSQSLPQRWKRGRQRAALSALAFLTLLTGALHTQGGADKLGSWWLRARFSLREALGGAQRDPRIAIVEIDDKSLDQWKDEPLILWGGHMADTINQLTRSGARLIALDWTQTVEVDSKFGGNNDYKLGLALKRAKNVVFVKFIRSDGNYVLPTSSLLYALPDASQDGGESHLGFAELLRQDSVQSTLLPQIPSEEAGGKAEVSFAARIAQKSGLPMVEGPPLREDGSLLINYSNNAGARGDLSPFDRASLSDVARATQPDPRWKDKIVFIGANYKGSDDSHNVPFLNGLTGAREISGVEIQAQSVKTLLDGSAIDEPEGVAMWLVSWLVGAAGVGAFALWSWGRAAWVTVAFVCGWTLLSFVLFWGMHVSLPIVLPFLSLLVGCALMGGYRGLSEELERAQVMKIWGRHQDPRLIQELLAHPEWRGGQGRELEVTVLFADLKNFTKTVEALPPTEALEALNRYLALLSQTILEHGGVVDKYLGDGLMAQWGAPAGRPDHATAAVRACLAIEKRINELTTTLRAAGKVAFETRLTLHTGPVVAGPLGSEDRLEYTIIGDTVNVTSRLQETAKALGCDFLISQTTCEALHGTVATGRETEVEIRGRIAPLKVFEVLDDDIHEMPAAEFAIEPATQKAKTSQNTDSSP